MNQRWVYWCLVISWCTLVFIITSSPAATSENTSSIIRAETNAPPITVHKLDFGIRKTAHVTMFGVLAILVLLAIWGWKNALIKAWVFATFYGATDEIHQIFETGRTPTVSDVFIDSTGAFAALLFFYLLRKIIIKSKLRREV
ncbi:VanZ family protein [Paenibacillus solisilvae]|uniref:VanZ family protein n=1 Tax=Paenibacillus solisilvae TaxID=2486751 RepID=A0ABW0VXD7_9BACL